MKLITGLFALWCLVHSFQAELSPAGFTRMVGGDDVELGQFPFVVHLYIHDQGQRRQCLGTLVTPDSVLTSAQCMLDTQNKVNLNLTVEAVVGSVENVPTNQGVYIEVKDYLLQPNYTANALSNNLAVVYLQSNVTLNANTTTVQVYNKAIDEDTGVTVVGSDDDDKPTDTDPGDLQFAPLKVGNETQCQKVVKDYYRNGPTLCVMTSDEPDICQGDSGGPLLIQEGKSWYLVGFLGGKNIVSGSSQCGGAGGVSFFTRVAHYLPWLTTQAGLKNSTITFGTGGEPADPPANITQTDDTTITTTTPESKSLSAPKLDWWWCLPLGGLLSLALV
ncbi:hypothetical protein H4R33_000217 [Dimargaris cristalligena]|nr:hypothetical protein H4R33_000217 [Dimargaris cristalligena]